MTVADGQVGAEWRVPPITFLPTPMEDETLYSLLARQRAALGARLRLPFIEAAFGRGARRVETLMPINLRRFAAALGDDPEARRDALLHRWTALAYFAPFANDRTHARLKVELWRGARSKWSGSLAKGIRHPFLNFCSECRTEDVRSSGQAAWRRLHQLPGVYACPGHGLMLRASEVPSTASYQLAPCPISDRGRCLGEWAPFPPARAVRIATCAGWLLRNPGPPPAAATVQAAFRTLLDRTGRLSRGGRASSGLADAVALSLRSGDGASRAVADRCRLSLQRVWGRAAELNVPTLAVLVALEHLGSTASELMALCADPTIGAAKAENLRPPAKVRASTVARHRKTLQSALAGQPKAGRTTLKAAVPTSYRFLLEHDRPWFDAVMPTASRARDADDWSSKDLLWSRLATGAVRKLLVVPGRPQRLTFAAIVDEMGLRTTLYRRDPRLPATFAIIDAAVEAVPDLMRRRVLWALGTSAGESAPTWSAFVRIAGFKESLAGAETSNWARLAFHR